LKRKFSFKFTATESLQEWLRMNQWDRKQSIKIASRASMNGTEDCSIDQSINQSIHKSINESMNQSINQSINRQMNCLINQSIAFVFPIVSTILTKSCFSSGIPSKRGLKRNQQSLLSLRLNISFVR
jgi:hypothetical protein